MIKQSNLTENKNLATQSIIYFSEINRVKVLVKRNHFAGRRYILRHSSVKKLMNTVPGVQHDGGNIMLCACFYASGTGTLHKVDRIMNKLYMPTSSLRLSLKQEKRRFI